MGTIEQKIMEQALRKYKKIYPCGSKKSLWECFTRYNDSVLFWFNTEDDTTHMIRQDNVMDVHTGFGLYEQARAA